jgi:hypothetical protein
MPYYEALSYVWGDPTVTELILVDGQEVQVTTNLKALRRLRWVTRARPLWIDALSINQSDLIEKGYQIGLMTDIYFHASAVICWLGEEADDSDVALFLLDEVGRTPDTPAYDAVDLLKDATCSRFAEPLEKILESAWWSCDWILQEVSFGKNLLMYCSGRSIFWKQGLGIWNHLGVVANWLLEAYRNSWGSCWGPVNYTYRKPLWKLLGAYKIDLGKLLGKLLGAYKIHLGKHLGKLLGKLLGGL